MFFRVILHTLAVLVMASAAAGPGLADAGGKPPVTPLSMNAPCGPQKVVVPAPDESGAKKKDKLTLSFVGDNVPAPSLKQPCYSAPPTIAPPVMPVVTQAGPRLAQPQIKAPAGPKQKVPEIVKIKPVKFGETGKSETMEPLEADRRTVKPATPGKKTEKPRFIHLQ